MDFNVRPFRADAVGAPSNFIEPFEFMTSARALDLEIGCGVGYHPIQYARANPYRHLIAIEHTREKFEKFESRLLGHSPLPNLLPIHADAVRWVTHALPPATLDQCFILYPNPEPKAASRRWIRMPFFHRLMETLKPTGVINFATNEDWYADEVREWAVQYWKLEIVQDLRLSGAGVKPRTHFEKKYLERGETCYDIHLRRSIGG